MDFWGVISCEDSMVITNGRGESASFVQRGVSVLQGRDMIQVANACMLEISTRLRQHKRIPPRDHLSRYV